MPLTPEEVKQIQEQIKLAAVGAAPIVALLGPEATGMLIVGNVIAQRVPEAVAIVQKWVAGAAPTPEEEAQVAAELAILSNPDLP